MRSLGRIVLYLPCATLLYEWFFARRGTASGIMFAGTGVGGTVFPFVVAGLLDRFGYRTAMVSLGLGWGILGGISIIAIKRRIPLLSRRRPENDSRSRTGVDWSFAFRGSLLMGLAIITLTGLGSFIPSVWIPGTLQVRLIPLSWLTHVQSAFASDLNIVKLDGVSFIALMNGPSINPHVSYLMGGSCIRARQLPPRVLVRSMATAFCYYPVLLGYCFVMPVSMGLRNIRWSIDRVCVDFWLIWFELRCSVDEDVAY